MPSIRSVIAFSISSLSLCANAVHALGPRQDGNNDTESTSTSTSTLHLTSVKIVTVAATGATATGNATLLPTAGTGLEYASKCNSAKLDWLSSRGSSVVANSTFQTTTSDISVDFSTDLITTTSLAPGATPYTLCDGYTRLNGTTNFTASTHYKTTTLFSTFATTTPVYANVTAPNCIIKSNDCAYLNSSYYKTSSEFYAWSTSSFSAYYSSQPFTRQPPPSPSERSPPRCGTVTLPPFSTTELPPPACIVNTARVQLLYWPVTTTSGCDLCSLDKCAVQTPAPTISGSPNTYVTMNTTLTSPTVYIAFEGDWTLTSEGQVVTDKQRLIFPQTASAVSSLCGKVGGGFQEQARPFNYADLNGPVPASAYRCQPKCFTNPGSIAKLLATYTTSGEVTTGTSLTFSAEATENLCSTIWNDYNPALSIPPELSTISLSQGSGESFGCNFTAVSGGVLFDPPMALTQADHIVVPTAPGAPAQTTDGGSSPTPQPGSNAEVTLPRTTGPAPTPSAVADNTPQASEDSTPAASPSQAAPQSGDPSDPASAETTQNIGGIIASALGMTSASPAADPVSNGGSQASEAPPSGNGQSPSASAPASPLVLTDASSQKLTVANNPSGDGIVLGSATLAAGKTTNVPGVGDIVAQTSGVYVDATYQALPPPAASVTAAVIQASGNSAVTVAQPASDKVVIGSETVQVGATTSIAGIGNVVAGSSAIVVDGTTQAYSAVNAAPTPQGPAAFSAGDNTFTAASDGTFSIASGHVLTPGGVATVSGTTFSLDKDGDNVVVNGVTQTLSSQAQSTGPSILSAGDHTFTAASDGSFSIASGEVLTPGGVVTVSGTTYSLDKSGDDVVVNGVTQTLSASSQSATSSDSSASTSSDDATSTSSRSNGQSSNGTPTQAAQSTQSSSAASVTQRHSLFAAVAGFIALFALTGR